MRTINYTKPEPRIFVEYQGRRMALLDQQRHHGKPAKPISERDERRGIRSRIRYAQAWQLEDAEAI